ncbi:class I SAM-dependent methyltransferase [Lysobacter soli]|uniref:class I SAM-dependent methyltransferase n=1 Tax=Lysobacter soli TaxID=453783 RepID=UPI00209F880D|nr:class I SAM-dependent methyltransferase [Lysobacter soli]UTA54189.1 class I SAM-dependent methyltransferase [Lysobacter soli]
MSKAAPSKIEIGCGRAKRVGYFGIDISENSDADLVLDVEKQRLPFADNSISHVYSSHAFEHMTEFPHVFREIFRVCRPGAEVEIWTPYGKSNDGLLFGHYVFFTETSFKHICYEYDRFYLADAPGFFDWRRSAYNLLPGIRARLHEMNIPLEFALEHMFNVCMEWGVMLTVNKEHARAPGPQIPERLYGEGVRPEW